MMAEILDKFYRLIRFLLVKNPFAVFNTIDQDLINFFYPFTRPDLAGCYGVIVFPDIPKILFNYLSKLPISKPFSFLLAANIRLIG